MSKGNINELNIKKIEEQKRDFGRAGRDIINIFNKCKENKGDNENGRKYKNKFN